MTTVPQYFTLVFSYLNYFFLLISFTRNERGLRRRRKERGGKAESVRGGRDGERERVKRGREGEEEGRKKG